MMLEFAYREAATIGCTRHTDAATAATVRAIDGRTTVRLVARVTARNIMGWFSAAIATSNKRRVSTKSGIRCPNDFQSSHRYYYS
jgi:hypothetical protein